MDGTAMTWIHEKTRHQSRAVKRAYGGQLVPGFPKD